MKNIEEHSWQDISIISDEKILETIIEISKKDGRDGSLSLGRVKKSLEGRRGVFLGSSLGEIKALGWREDRGERIFLWLAVDPSYRKQGLGSALLEEIKREIKDSGLSDRELRIMLWDAAKDTMEFFRSRGFDHMYTEIKMEKPLELPVDRENGLKIESFTEEKLPLFYSLYRSAFSTRTSDLLTQERWSSFWCPVDDPEFTNDMSLILYEDNKPVTYLVTYCEEKSELVIGQLGTAYEYRKKGYGSEILDEVSLRAYKNGYKKLSLRVDEDNEGAIQLYTVAGFSPVSALTMFRKVQKFT